MYDFDAGIGTDESDLGVINLGTVFPFFPPATDSLFQSSQNLAFSFLATDALPFLAAPSGSFNPFAAGEYTFALRSSVLNETVAINVDVAAVPLPAALPLLGTGFAALGLFGWRRKRKAA